MHFTPENVIASGTHANLITNNTNSIGILQPSVDLNTAKIGYPSMRNNFFYARRIKLLGAATTNTTWHIPAGESVIIWNKNIINGSLNYDTSTGILTTSITGLFSIKAKICVTTTNAERMCKIGLRVNGGTDVILGKNHLSKHDSHNSSFSAPEIDGHVRLAVGRNYEFFIECLEGSTGVVFNYQYENNDLRIEGLPLPDGYVLPPDYTLGGG